MNTKIIAAAAAALVTLGTAGSAFAGFSTVSTQSPGVVDVKPVAANIADGSASDGPATTRTGDGSILIGTHSPVFVTPVFTIDGKDPALGSNR